MHRFSQDSEMIKQYSVPYRRPIATNSKGCELFGATSFRSTATSLPSNPTVVRWAFVAFVFVLPFEALGAVKIVSLVFFGFYFFYYNPLSIRRLPQIQPALGWFILFVLVFGFKCWFAPSELGRLITLVMLLVFVWIATDLLKDRRTARDALAAYFIASVLVAIGVVSRVPGIYTEWEAADGIRVSAFGEDPNNFSLLMAVGAIALTGLLLNGDLKRFSLKIISIPFACLLLFSIVETGSRTGMVAFAIGVLTYILSFGKLHHKIAAIVLGVSVLGAMVFIVFQNPTTLARWEESLYEGKMAGRENISAAALNMIVEKPLFGWNLADSQWELGRRVGVIFREKDAHNMFLGILLEVGAVGAIPFLIGLLLCILTGYRERKGPLGTVPIAMLATLLTGSLGVTMIYRKPLWLAVALCLASCASSQRRSPGFYPIKLGGPRYAK